jgi:hypothetical protein
MRTMSKTEIRRRGLQHAETIKRDLRVMMAKRGGGDRIVNKLHVAVLREKVNGFSDLHDVMDANMLGDVNDVLDINAVSEEYRGFVTTNEWTEDEARTQTWCDVLNVAQTEVDHWIKIGGLREP